MKKKILTLAVAVTSLVLTAQTTSRSANPVVPPIWCPPICSK
jgi:hypothetical protein